MEKLWGGDKSIRAAHFWERGLTLPSLPHGEIEARPQGNPHQFPPPPPPYTWCSHIATLRSFLGAVWSFCCAWTARGRCFPSAGTVLTQEAICSAALEKLTVVILFLPQIR